MSNRVDDFLNKIQTKEVNLTKIAKEVGISYGKMHKWKQRNIQSAQINQEDYKKLSNYLDGKKDLDDDLDKSLDIKKDINENVLLILAQSNQALCEANRELAESNKILAENNRRIISTVGDSQEIPAKVAEKLSDLVHLIQMLEKGQPTGEAINKFWTVEKSSSS